MATQIDEKAVTPKSQDFDRWYTDVVRRAELADYTPVAGCMVIRPYGYALWENIRDALDDMIKATGHENMYFPLFIPESYLLKEAEHVEGFSPQVAWVTHGGDKELDERLAIRPTSEAIINPLFANWIQSWRDLPVLINQWANVVRWEKRTRMFLRTTEFLWQEGHTFHETLEQASEEAYKMSGCYKDLLVDWLALAVVSGKKTDSEKFAGAEYTLTHEAMMSDGLALQGCTSHNLGQNFGKAYEIKFTDRNNVEQNPYGTSWGLTTRTVGAVIMAHGDDRGLILPPKIAPIQAVVVPIAGKDESVNNAIEDAVVKIEKASVGNVRMKVDRREGIRPGEKYAHWELRGVPLRIVLGAKDLEQNQVTVVRRVDGQETKVALDVVVSELPQMLEEAQGLIKQRADQMLADRSCEVANLDELKAAFEAEPVFANAPFCNSEACERGVVEAVHAVSVRCLRDDRQGEGRPCLVCGKPSEHIALIAKAY